MLCYILASAAQGSMQAPDVEYERQPCPHANKGLCRYKDGECKYRHTRCQNYDSCSQSSCLLAHAPRSSSKHCFSGIRCFNADCRFEHPEGWNACNDGVQCTNYECIFNHPSDRPNKCPNGNSCNNNNCKLLHPNRRIEVCSWGSQCRKWDCTKAHPIGRTQLCPDADHCTNKPCSYLHPSSHIKIYIEQEAVHNFVKQQTSEIIELSGAQNNFLQFSGVKILDTIRKEQGIKEANVKDGKLQLSGNNSAITNIKSYLKQALHEQNVTITNSLKKYLQSFAKGRLMKRFLQKYSVGISYLKISPNASLTPTNDMNTGKNRVDGHDKDESEKQYDNDPDLDQSEDEQEDDDDDGMSDISTTSSNVTNISGNFKHRRNFAQKFVQVTLCSDSEDSLSNAIKELQSYSLYNQSWTLTQDEITYILKQPQPGKPSQNNTKVRDQCFQIKYYLNDLVQSRANSIVHIFLNYKNGVWRVKVRGFKDHVNNAVSKIKNYLNDFVETEVQLPISKAMTIFLRKKVSSDVRKLEKTHCIKITTFSPPIRKHVNDEEDGDNDCLKLTGSNSRIHSAQSSVENFLESLAEQEKQFPCHSWDISNNISKIIRTRLRQMEDSDDCEAIGWVLRYTATERRDTTPKVAISIVGRNEEAVDDVAEQCQDIAEGYIIWKPSANQYRNISSVLWGKGGPSIDEFRQQWKTDIRFDRDTSTITIPARSKMIADDIKEALLNLGEEKKTRINRISEFIPIQLNIRCFVNQAIGSLLDEAKSQKIFVESKNSNGLTLHGQSNIVTELKQKINSIIDDIVQKKITRPLKLSSIESDLMRTNSYNLAKRIERETNTIIRNVEADKTSLKLMINYDDISSTIIAVANDRGQTIIVEKGDITKAKNVDAIVNAANGSLYHAGGIDKAIADAAGPVFDQECKQLIVKNGDLPIPAGKAVKTTAGNLPFKCVIHAIGPQYTGGNQQEQPLLFFSVLSSLQLAEEENYTSVALPAISSKTYGFPLADCTNIMVRAVKQFFADYPQSKVKKVILLDLDDAACNSFAREVAIDHSNAVLDNEDDIMNYELPPLTAKWCWQDDHDEKINNDSDIRKIESAFQQYLKTSISPELEIAPDNLKSGTIVNYSIHFRPDLKQLLTKNPSALNSRLVCGYQMRKDTDYTRNIIRYPVVVQQQNQVKSVNYRPKPLDSYHLQLVMTEENWNITGITDTAVEQAQEAIRAAIHSATISESFSINLTKDLDYHKKELIKIATQQLIQINFQEECSEQLSMILKGFKANVSEAKLKIALYAQDILKMQVENDDELRIPKEWGDQREGCKLLEIPKNDPTFARIENRMKETMNKVKIDKIERVQNIRMWNHYAFHRRELKKELCLTPNLQIEMELFHGTRSTLPSEIYNGEYGFDMTFSTSGMWGLGTYFAKNASYSSSNYAYQLPNGKRQVFLAQVLTGDVYDCNSDSSLRRPPKKNETMSGLRYNSVSGDTGDSKVYIVYENRVAYPTYLITFTS
ncbi:unnamed protein product [Rotaria sp. Silwood1]|nr:unnamed protein product [Rotaria sp. Silwood1]CAF4713214.1 unnamed protein product [Rotaria sp. Silwood1]